MPYDFKKFIFSVSLCAMLVVNPVLATAPTNDEDLDTTHDVYVESTLNQATNGIAGVSYVNRMVNAAGNAADAAEAHAAAAGAHALSAAQSADEAHKVLADKVNIDQGADNKNKVMVTNASGYVAPGYITNDMLAAGAVTSGTIAIGAVTASIIADGAVTNSKIADSAVTLDKIAAEKYEQPQSNAGNDGVLLAWSMSGDTNQLQWRKIRAGDIGDGAVTIEKTEGVVGMVPVGGEGATTYGSFWIE